MTKRRLARFALAAPVLLAAAAVLLVLFAPLTTAGLVGGFVGVIAVALIDPGWLRGREEERPPSPVQTGQSAPQPRRGVRVAGAALLTVVLLVARRSS